MAVSVSTSRGKHYILDSMGITQWQVRPATQITLTPCTNTVRLVSNKPLFCARCLVLLPTNPHKNSSEENKVLTGMLQVLELSAEELGIAWLEEPLEATSTLSTSENPILSSLLPQIIQWAPYSLLIMGESFLKTLDDNNTVFDEYRLQLQHFCGLDIPLQATYYPSELLTKPENKKKAYRDLLAHKAWLNNIKAEVRTT